MRSKLVMGACLALTFSGCSGGESMAGKPAGSETSEELAARVVDPEGKPVPGARVRLRPESFSPDSIRLGDTLDVMADSNGKFHWPAPRAGRWILEARSADKGWVMPWNWADTTSVRQVVVRPYGRIRGSVALPAGQGSARIRIPGVDRIDSTDNAGGFDLVGVSPGDSSQRVRLYRSSNGAVLAETLLQVRPGVVADLGRLPEISQLLSSFDQADQGGVRAFGGGQWVELPCFPWCSSDTVAKGRQGEGVRFQFLPNAINNPHQVLFLGGYRNISDMDSVEVWVKGKAKVYLVVGPDASFLRRIDTAFTDDPNWRRVVFRPRESGRWKIDYGESLRVSQFVEIELDVSVGSSDVVLDDVRMFGVDTRQW